MSSKQYGLIIPGKPVKRPAIFDEDSDSETEIQRPSTNTKLKKQDKITYSKALEEDPTVFQYDEVYDEIDKKRKESKLSRKDLDKKPKYINRLLAAAQRRKIENERRIERQVQREREAEGDEFKDKESFVTNAYRKKLEEMKEMEELEKREEYLETIGDVRKQGNLDGFYRHLYDQKVNYEDKPSEAVVEVKEEKKDEESNNEKEDDESNNEKEDKEEQSKHKKRKYRKRNDSSGSDNEDDKKMEHLPSNLDADSDFSIDSSDSEGEESKIKKESDTVETKIIPPPSDDVKEEKTDQKEKEEPKIIKEEKKVKIDIWKKRTVGEVFDAAVQRYFERKAIREL